MTNYYTYILECEDGSYYTGYSNDPYVRFEKHKVYSFSQTCSNGAFVTSSIKRGSNAIRVSYQTFITLIQNSTYSMVGAS